MRPESFEEALQWATEPLHATSSLLLPARDERYLAFDYLPDILDADPNSEPVPISTWQKLIQCATAADVFEVGQTAYTRRCLDHAQAAFRKAEEGGNSSATLWIAIASAQADVLPRRSSSCKKPSPAAAVDSASTTLTRSQPGTNLRIGLQKLDRKM